MAAGTSEIAAKPKLSAKDEVRALLDRLPDSVCWRTSRSITRDLQSGIGADNRFAQYHASTSIPAPPS
jgi:hypothetical protein